MSEWQYLKENGSRSEKLTFRELKHAYQSGAINDDTLVSDGQTSYWKKISEQQGLSEQLGSEEPQKATVESTSSSQQESAPPVLTKNSTNTFSAKLRLPLVLLTITTIILGGTFYAYQFYSTRHLDDYHAYLAIGNLEKGVASLEQHILQNPSDVSSRLILIERLLDLEQLSRATGMLETIETNQLNETNRSKFYTIKIDMLSPRIEELDQLFEENYLNESADLDGLAQIASDRFDQYSIRSTYVYLRDGKFQSEELVNDAEAGKNFIEWRKDGDLPFTTCNDASSLRDLLREFATAQFGQENWLLASSAYEAESELLQEHRYCEDKIFFRSLLPEAIYNHAVSEYNAERYWISSRILRELAEEWPNYSKEEVDDLTARSAYGSRWQHLRSLDKKAGELFEGKDWSAAIAAYRTMIEYASRWKESAFVSEKNRATYNMAISQAKAERYGDAMRTLEKLQRDAPDYDPNLVNERLLRYKQIPTYLDKSVGGN